MYMSLFYLIHIIHHFLLACLYHNTWATQQQANTYISGEPAGSVHINSSRRCPIRAFWHEGCYVVCNYNYWGYFIFPRPQIHINVSHIMTPFSNIHSIIREPMLFFVSTTVQQFTSQEVLCTVLRGFLRRENKQETVAALLLRSELKWFVYVWHVKK
jgi:hypothetical protein